MSAAAAPLRLLFVEDSEDDARLALRALARGGVEAVHERVAGAAALEAALARGPWDAVICDFRMPGFGGMQALALVRARARELPFLLVSGAIDAHTAVAAMKAGANDYVRKDELVRLAPALERELAEAAARAARREAEAALATSEARFRSLTAMSSDFYWETDGEHRLTMRGAESKPSPVGAFQSGAQIGKRRWEVPHLSPGEVGWAAHRAELDAHRPFRDFELSRRSADGIERFFSLSGDPVFDAAGRFCGYRGVGADVTARKRQAARLDRLSRMYRMLWRASRTLGQLAERTALLEAAAHIAVDEGGFAIAWCGLPQGGWLEVAAAAVKDGGPLPAFVRAATDPALAEGRGPSGRAFREGVPVIFNDALAEPSLAPWREGHLAHGIGALASFPLRVAGRIAGTFSVQHASPGYFDAELVALLEEFSAIAEQALERLELTADRDRAQRARAEATENLRLAVEGGGIGLWQVDFVRRRVQWNDRHREMVGLDAGEVTLERFLGLVHPEDRPLLEQATAQALADGEGPAVDFRVVRPDGEVRWLSSRARAERDASGAPLRARGAAIDITARKQQEARIVRLARVQAMLAGMGAAIVRLREPRPLFAEACRIAVEEGGYLGACVLAAGSDAQEAAAGTAAGGERVALALGERATLVLHAAAAPDAGEARLLEGMAADLAFALEHIDSRARLAYVAHHDLLTGLANQALLLERIAHELGRHARPGAVSVLAVLDLDRFHEVNDSLGRAAGDELLRQVAARLAPLPRPSDTLARIGSNRFALFAADVRSEDDVVRVLREKMLEPLEQAFALGGAELRVVARAGVALAPRDAADAEGLLRSAEAALKRARTERERLALYAPELNARVAERLLLTSELRGALERGELVLFYQPKFDLAGGARCGAEALMRWRHPRRGLVPPADFVPLLEETGLVVEAGEWAIGAALAQERRWRAAGAPPCRVAVNVSALQLRRDDFVERVAAAIARAGAAPQALELEITETLLMQDFDATVAKLARLRAMGVTVALDDFGTGYSSLGYFARLPVDRVKIDRSFVAAMARDERAGAVVKAVIALAHGLRIAVTAEGVETAEQAALLAALGCEEGQGYHFARPAPAEEESGA